MLTGSCCCGGIKFEVDDEPGMLGMCHCSRCRKVGATAILFVKAEHLRITEGRDKISTYKANPPYKYDRSFCAVCGTALGEILSAEGVFPIAANCIDGKLGVDVRFHEFVAEKPDWLKIGDDAKQFEHHPS